MKIKQLIQELSKLNPNLQVVLSSDAEGNSYSILYDVIPEDDISNFIESEKPKGCIVLYPG